MTAPTYEVYAIRYAQRAGRRPEHFLGGDPHDAPMPMDYFVWLVRNSERQGYAKLDRLAESQRHIVPGQDPLVMRRYPVASPGLEGIAVRLDAEPVY